MILLEVSHLTKRFGGLTAVHNLNFHVSDGEVLSIIGPNGSGKTTVFNLLTGFYKPNSGVIEFDGHDLLGRKPYHVARLGIGRTFQKTTVFSGATALENVIVGRALHAQTGFLRAIIKTPKNRLEERRIRQKADEVLHFVGLSDRKNTLAKNLTQEAQKRLSIAIAIATDPKLLLLDEPTGDINLDEIDALMRLMEKIRKDGITICLIEHKMRVVMSISDRIVALSYGEKVAEGRPQEVASNPKVIKAYLGERYASRSDMRFTSS